MKRPFLNQGERQIMRIDCLTGDLLKLKLAWNHFTKAFVCSGVLYIFFGIWLGVLLLGLLSLIGIKIYE